MVQYSLKDSLENVRHLREQMEAQIRPQVDAASIELRKMLKDMGADPSENASLADIVSQIRERNPSLRQLAMRLDIATYDVRRKLIWNANMMSAYLSDRAGKAYELDVKPKLRHYRTSAESRAKALIDQWHDLRPKQNDTGNHGND
ncbi:hypothetical protein EZI54_00060 [Marinobacter halodurans]|uniref:Uncharacterized protein n=1 Tax=Marinobacter halodurans TaxID=2528979 RepID=A0ABY1ZUC0_9GAMM|nr:hypothetical protein [Marinobacter halodurans]TBW59392.1 hypothetical protein EZI54_00060 [Marinobacter halodurans]